ncbi:cobalamin biosynthesis protein CobD [Sphingobium indicum]|uniref:Cobalamin biosynthesis protein CobD n=1 Tax=Sphingobium indicum TaxID=332055 RepID=A0A4Q4J6H9_9SPHN|nr:adenosylcobinamide-phosphate synthase CbiB [Sphingobium indicum]NYI23503.1 adenosylcobinamide-phosphate synthase [Sphingobium indicum]RYM01631.1 cobalamin biosynthesis protein CobD [Sphingobium indicum]
MGEPAGLAALMLDAALGWPGWLHARIGHPVGGFARIIGAAERRWNREAWSGRVRRWTGLALLLLLLGVGGGVGLALEWAIRRWGGGTAWPWLALAAWPALAQNSLYVHVAPVVRALAKGEMDAARQAVARIVGRDTAALDEAGVARAGIESLAESFCDGVVAPLFWLLLLGLPGIWAYKAVNTADSMIGHKEAPYTDFGCAAARFDDLLNWVPARLAGLILCVAGGGGWAVLRRDHGRHASPNAGWPEAAMAGALGIRLAGPIRYDGVLHDKPWIGTGGEADVRAMKAALRIYVRACLLLWGLAAIWEGVG